MGHRGLSLYSKLYLTLNKSILDNAMENIKVINDI
jgi:hypothetical protein